MKHTRPDPHAAHLRRLEAAARAGRQILVERWCHARAAHAPEAYTAIALLTAGLEDREVREIEDVSE